MPPGGSVLSFPRPMQGLHVELVLALQFDKAHRRPGHRLCDPLGVAIVVLLRLDVGPDIFGRHQPDVVAVGGEHAAEMMSPAAGLHPDNARRKLLRQSNQRLRLITTAPDASSPTTLQTFLPRSTPSTEISIPSSS